MILYQINCRYCLSDLDNEYSLIIPCNCKNGVHKECLTEWILHRPYSKIEDLHYCEICKLKYKISLDDIIQQKFNNNENHSIRFYVFVFCYLCFIFIIFMYPLTFVSNIIDLVN